MKKILLIIIFIIFPNIVFSNYNLENGSLDLVKKYNFSTKNLEKPITRKEFLESLSKWYSDYKAKKGVKIDYKNFEKIDNKKYFKDIDLNSEFGKKLQYFSGLGAFSKKEFFDEKGILTQKDFFNIMKKLGILNSLENCKNLKICEKEATKNNIFNKGTYLKYVSKILNPELRKYFSNPNDYIKAGYKAFLDKNYKFPLQKQTLNGCYAFSVRNILKHKNNLGIYVPKAEKIIGKNGNDLWNPKTMKDFNNVSKTEIEMFYDLDTLINSLQVGDPIAITYMLDYYSYKEKKYKKVPHIVAAYSFDKNGVWVSETVSNTRKNISWNEIFKENGKIKVNRMFKFFYKEKKFWSETEKIFENKNNILSGEF
ncbi:hypothetical protein DLH72_03240 [Candidatus Gracilibacteria bacterium]|nr:MAG: hypothetical protein DLH72_03240 [Candidatus Gracilibacteria bacterium]